MSRLEDAITIKPSTFSYKIQFEKLEMSLICAYSKQPETTFTGAPTRTYKDGER